MKCKFAPKNIVDCEHCLYKDCCEVFISYWDAVYESMGDDL